ncbi:MAG: VOC family protein [Saprospiraceae bacterium]
MSKNKKMSPVVHFEMPYKDRDRMVSFYETVFGWEMTKLGPETMDYVYAKTAEANIERDKMYENVARGAIGGGFYPFKPDWPSQHPSIVIAVDDIEESMELINNNGGEVLGEPMEIPNNGTYVSFYDTEGNRVSIIQPSPM